MATRTLAKKTKPAPVKTEEVAPEAPVEQSKADKLKADIDDLLDEIDEVLEDNAEEFVKNYIQKGGQ